ncbi:MAG: undecaprenyldiphospho-muramoylpentapeptide beta-N-acetylglucosaminyltransferase [Alicyclobacillaceae bacterium]|nr:undecaprenyldiphospho-muramoylpentapeptide beta-N-acetylglucosaminyltransferase [Alicyclobacillaceae bacterium]
MRILLTGGGTGGHIYPALTLWAHVQRLHPDAQVLYIGGERGLERTLVERSGLPMEQIPAAGLKRQLSWSALRTAVTTYRGYRRALGLLRRFDPDVVVGTGGYVTLPVVFAAHRLGIPAVVWEANARPGLTNRLCARWVAAVAVSFPGSEPYFAAAKRVVVTGNPRASEAARVTREEVAEALARHRIDPAKKLILCFAGSRGAETVNEVVVELIPRFRTRPKWQFLYVTGEAHHERIASRLSTRPDNVRVVPFLYDMPQVMSAADVVITRAGGATLAEICALGVAAVLIPSPFVTDNHQEENARRLAERGAARMIRESDLTPQRLWDELSDLLDGGSAAPMRHAARALATPDAVDRLYEVVMAAMRRTVP